VRHTVIDVGDYGAISLVAFLDAGRPSKPELTLKRVAGGRRCASLKRDRPRFRSTCHRPGTGYLLDGVGKIYGEP
jgi:hypothetical protein